jgi:hypothetical protein
VKRAKYLRAAEYTVSRLQAELNEQHRQNGRLRREIKQSAKH